MVKITYYLDVVSSWCHYVEPVWDFLKEEYAAEVTFDWRIALIPSEGLPESTFEEDGYYRRSGVITRQTQMLNSAWVDPTLKEYLAPNVVAVAAKELGFKGDEVRRAIAHAAMIEGKQVGQFEVSAEVAAQASGLDKEDILALSQSELVEEEVRGDTRAFNSFGINQRPAFHLVSEIQDQAIFSGIIHLGPLQATLDAMIEDVTAYRSWDAHFGQQ